jgi:hypothetical protein
MPIGLIGLIIDPGFLLLDVVDFNIFYTSNFFGFYIPWPDRAGG